MTSRLELANEIYHRLDLDKAYILIQRTASVIVDRYGVIQYLKRATNPQLWREESQELLKTVQKPAQITQPTQATHRSS